MAVSNSFGSNVFDILVGLSLPWFVETTFVYPGTVALINSRGLYYAIILLFMSLVATVGLFHHHNWTLNPQLGKTLLICYALFLFSCSILEFNVIDVNNVGVCED
jgi:Ca2+/Na+ antiporter